MITNKHGAILNVSSSTGFLLIPGFAVYFSTKSYVISFSVFFFKQKTAYEIVPCDWSSDVCSSDPSRRRHTRTPVTRNNLVCRLLLGSEEHTSELQSHGTISYAVFCLKKKKKNIYKLTNKRNINEKKR